MALVVAAVSEDGRDAARWEVFGVTGNQQAVFPGNPGDVNAPGRPVVNALGAYWSHDKTDDELGLVKVSQDTHADCLGCAVQSSTVAVLEGVAIKTVSDYHAVHSDSLVAAVACGKQTVADVAVAATDGLKKSADFPAKECDKTCLRLLSLCQNWLARPISLQRKCNNLQAWNFCMIIPHPPPPPPPFFWRSTCIC